MSQSQIDSLFKLVIKLIPTERNVLLASLQSDLQQQLMDLLAADSNADRDRFMNPTEIRFPNAAVGAEGDSDSSLPDSEFRFEIVRKHDEGNLGIVLIARDKELNREVALKEIKPEQLDERSREQFLIEAMVTGNLEHPGIVPVYSLGQHPEDGRPYYAMRFVRGRNLQKLIDAFYHDDDSSAADRRLVFRRLLKNFVDVCNAVGYAHSRGVVHRDLKPANIMVGNHGETLVVDWGLAGVIGTSRLPESEQASSKTLPVFEEHPLEDGSFFGSPAYMPPEQANGEVSSMDHRSDIYSLGAVLYQIITGQPPFEGNQIKVMVQVVNGQFPKPSEVRSEVNQSLEVICLNAMSLKMADRYQSSSDLAHAIERWMADEPVLPFRSAIAWWESETARNPSEPIYRIELAIEQRKLSMVLQAMNRLEDALDSARKSCESLQGLESDNTHQSIRFRSELISSRQQQLRVMKALKRPADVERLKQLNRRDLLELIREHGSDPAAHDAIYGLTLHGGMPLEEVQERLEETVPAESAADELQSALDRILNARDEDVRRIQLSESELELLRYRLDSLTQNANEQESGAFLAGAAHDLTVHPDPSDDFDLEGREDYSDAPSGNSFGNRYSQIKKIGSGGVADVYSAIDDKLGRKVAVKACRPGHSSTAEFIVNEAKLLANLVHPSIPPVFDSGASEEGQPFFTMPLYDPGQSLVARIDSMTTGSELRQRIDDFVAICSAVDYANSLGVLNLDPKPANVLFQDGRPVLIDWGLVSPIDSSRETGGRFNFLPTFDEGTVLGTLAYMSPEQARGETGSFGPPTTVFLLGATLYHLLSSGKAFLYQGKTLYRPFELISDAKVANFQSIHNVAPESPKRLRQICMKALAREQTDRYQQVGDMMHDINEWLAGRKGWFRR